MLDRKQAFCFVAVMFAVSPGQLKNAETAAAINNVDVTRKYDKKI